MPENKGFFARMGSNVAKVFGQGRSCNKKATLLSQGRQKYYLLGFIQNGKDKEICPEEDKSDLL